MEQIAPLGKVYQAGTLSGNPVAMAAGFATLSTLNNNQDIYQHINDTTQQLHNALEAAIKPSGIPFVINRYGSMISVHFSEKPVTNFEDAAEANNTLFNRYFHFMLEHGIYLPPSAFETWFISHAISGEDVAYTAEVTRRFFSEHV